MENLSFENLLLVTVLAMAAFTVGICVGLLTAADRWWRK